MSLRLTWTREKSVTLHLLHESKNNNQMKSVETHEDLKLPNMADGQLSFNACVFFFSPVAAPEPERPGPATHF